MKTQTHVGNVTLVLNGPIGQPNICVLLGHKRPKSRSDSKRKRRRIGIDKWVPPGGATESDDKSQKHAAQRELLQETGLSLPLRSFLKVGVLRGYITSPDTPTWIVHIYVVSLNQCVRVSPNVEYSEMRWFLLKKLPFTEMLQGDREWIPRIVRGEKLSIRIVANENADKAYSIRTEPIRSFN